MHRIVRFLLILALTGASPGLDFQQAWAQGRAGISGGRFSGQGPEKGVGAALVQPAAIALPARNSGFSGFDLFVLRFQEALKSARTEGLAVSPSGENQAVQNLAQAVSGDFSDSSPAAAPEELSSGGGERFKKLLGEGSVEPASAVRAQLLSAEGPDRGAQGRRAEESESAALGAASEDWKVRSIVIKRGTGYWDVDGQDSLFLDNGAFKVVLVHPKNPGWVIKVFHSLLGHVPFKKDSFERELENIGLLREIGAAPRLVGYGKTLLDGVEKDYLVQEGVLGSSPVYPSSPEQTRALRRLFGKMASHQLSFWDPDRKNLMIGATLSDPGPRAYETDAAAVKKTSDSREALFKEYEGILYGLTGQRVVFKRKEVSGPRHSEPDPREIVLKAFAWSWVPFAGGVAIHELGHFLAARYFKIPVAEVSLVHFGREDAKDYGYVRYARKITDPYQRAVVTLAGPAFALAYGLINLGFLYLSYSYSGEFDALAIYFYLLAGSGLYGFIGPFMLLNFGTFNELLSAYGDFKEHLREKNR